MRNPVYLTVVIAGLCLAAGYGLGKWGQSESEGHNPATIRRWLAADARTGPVEPSSTLKPRESLAGMSHDEVKRKTLEVLREPDRMLRMAGLMGVLAGMNEQNAAAVSEAVNERYRQGADTGPEGELIQF